MIFNTLILVGATAASLAQAAPKQVPPCGGPSNIACSTGFACITADAGAISNSNAAPVNNALGYCHPVVSTSGKTCGGTLFPASVCDSSKGLACHLEPGTTGDAGGVCRQLVTVEGGKCGGFIQYAPICDASLDLQCVLTRTNPDAGGHCQKIVKNTSA